MTCDQCINTNSQIIVDDSPDALQQEVSAIKFKLSQHADETRTELEQIKENLEYQLDQLKESYSLPEKINIKCCRTFLEHENARLRREYSQLKEENNTLKEKFNDFSFTVSD